MDQHHVLVSKLSPQQILQALDIAKERDENYIEHLHKGCQTDSEDGQTRLPIPSVAGLASSENVGPTVRRSFYDSKDSALGDSTGSDRLSSLGISGHSTLPGHHDAHKLPSLERQQLQNKIDILKAELTRVQYDWHKLLKAFQENYTGNTKPLESRVTELELKNKELEQRVVTKHALLEDVHRQYEDLKSKHLKSMDRITKISEDSGKAGSLHELFNSEPYKEQIAQLKSKNETLEFQVAEFQRENKDDLKKLLRESNSRNLKLQEENSTLHLELDDIKSQLKNLKRGASTRISMTSPKEQEYKDQIYSLQLQMQEYVDSKTRAEQETIKVKAKIEDIKRLSQMEKGDYQVELAKCNSQIKELSKSLSSYKEENTSLRYKLSQTARSPQPSKTIEVDKPKWSHGQYDTGITSSPRQKIPPSSLEREQQVFKQEFQRQQLPSDQRQKLITSDVSSLFTTPVRSKSDLHSITHFNVMQEEAAKKKFTCNNCLNVFEGQSQLEQHVKKCCLE